MSKHTSKKVLSAAKHKDFAEKLSGLQLIGEAVCWEGNGTSSWTHADVVKALRHAGLDDKIAREILPPQAFQRAKKKLAEDGVIDNVKESGAEIKFQLTRKFLADGQMRYEKETDIFLNPVTGEVTCSKKKLQEEAQNLLNSAIEKRTTGDITQIFNRVLKTNVEAWPFHPGVYVVPGDHEEFLAKIDKFFSKLEGCSLKRLPVPAGTESGDKVFQDAGESFFKSLITELNEAVDSFSVTTRGDTLERHAEKIKLLKARIEGYQSYLRRDIAEELLGAAVAEANKKLTAKIAALVDERKRLPPSERTSRSDTLFGHPVGKIIRWMARSWEAASTGAMRRTVAKVLKNMGIEDTPEKTVETQVYYGRKTEEPIPVLTKDEQRQLKEARDKEDDK